MRGIEDPQDGLAGMYHRSPASQAITKPHRLTLRRGPVHIGRASSHPMPCRQRHRCPAGKPDPPRDVGKPAATTIRYVAHGLVNTCSPPGSHRCPPTSWGNRCGSTHELAQVLLVVRSTSQVFQQAATGRRSMLCGGRSIGQPRSALHVVRKDAQVFLWSIDQGNRVSTKWNRAVSRASRPPAFG